VPEEELLHSLSQGAEVAFFVLQQLEHRYQFSSAELAFLPSVNERFIKETRITIDTIIFFMIIFY
jgi:hypothetical protein